MRRFSRLSSYLQRSTPKTKQARDRARSSFAPRIESLESRRLLAASIFEVTNTDNSGPGSLRAAILAANDNPGSDTIRFAKSGEGTILLSELGLDPGQGTLAITDDVAIEGPGTGSLTIDGQGAIRVFAVLSDELLASPYETPSAAAIASAPSVSISGLTVTGGLATDAYGLSPLEGFAFGGGLYNAGGEVELSRVRFSENSAASFVTAGGAVANEFGGTVNINRSQFVENSSNGIVIGVGGAITSDLGRLANGENTAQPHVSIERSLFESNSATATVGHTPGGAFTGLGGGGAILNVTGVMTISRSEFIDNAATGGDALDGSQVGGPAFGGAINSGDFSPFGSDDSQLTVERSTFVGNSATGGAGLGTDGGVASGGAIIVNNLGDADLSRNEFRDNRVQGGNAVADQDGISGSPGIGNGGAIGAAGGAEVSMYRNRLNNNTATGGTGPQASAAGRGGAIGSDSINLAGFVPGPAVVDLKHDRILGNEAAGAGGGIYNEGQMTIERADISRNLALGEASVFMGFYPGYEFQGVALGGGITNLGSIDVSRTTLHDNAAIGADGAVGPNILIDGSAYYPGLGVGGGLHNIGTAEVSRSDVTSNAAIGGNDNFGSFSGVGNGGGLYNDGTMIVSASTISKNTAEGGDRNVGDINAGGGFGGGIISGSVTALAPGGRSASLVVEHSKVSRNSATGGDENADLGIPAADVPAHQPSGAIGGGISVYQGVADVSRSMIVSNSVRGGEGGLAAGGGVFFFGFVGTVEATMSRSLVMHNRASGGEGADALGAGIAAGTLGSLFASNVAPVAVDVALHDIMVFHNRAQGGGRDADGNVGDALGGGIYNDSGSATSAIELKSSKVFANRAVADEGGEGIGGGIYNGSELQIIRSRIFANWASTSDSNCFGC